MCACVLSFQQAVADGKNRTDIQDIFDTWIMQMNYPVVMVTATTSQLEITQQRYLLDMNATDPGTHPSPFGYV
jgi:aminopeptidase N